jgi:hypothetical protein
MAGELDINNDKLLLDEGFKLVGNMWRVTCTTLRPEGSCPDHLFFRTCIYIFLNSIVDVLVVYWATGVHNHLPAPVYQTRHRPRGRALQRSWSRQWRVTIGFTDSAFFDNLDCKPSYITNWRTLTLSYLTLKTADECLFSVYFWCCELPLFFQGHSLLVRISRQHYGGLRYN